MIHFTEKRETKTDSEPIVRNIYYGVVNLKMILFYVHITQCTTPYSAWLDAIRLRSNSELFFSLTLQEVKMVQVLCALFATNEIVLSKR